MGSAGIGKISAHFFVKSLAEVIPYWREVQSDACTLKGE